MLRVRVTLRNDALRRQREVFRGAIPDRAGRTAHDGDL